MPCLLLKAKDGSTARQWNLRDHPLVVGRGDEVDARVADPQLSRRHFVIEPKGSMCVLRDLGSHNGTELNGQRITEAVLKAGDWIRAGQSSFVYDEGLSTVIRRMEEEERQLNIQPKDRELRQRRHSSEIFPDAFPEQSDKAD
jgi:pSer/pThr/pTyr-binding forkhead associated (FHA) protein